MSLDFTPAQLIEQLLRLPTPALNSQQLNQVVFSILLHHQQPTELHQGLYRGQQHHWLLWHQGTVCWRVDFRRFDLTAVDEGVREVAIDQHHYQSLKRYQCPAIPLVMLPSFCQQQHAHFDHLSGN